MDEAGVQPGDLVLDVGAGDGVLTSLLVEAGARVVAVELHRGRAELLRRRFADAPVTVVRADAADLRLPRRPFTVVANPPFGATTALLRRLTASGSRLLRADVVLQRSAAVRWVDGRAPGSGRWSRSLVADLGPRVPRRAFTPSPRVDCQVLVLERR